METDSPITDFSIKKKRHPYHLDEDTHPHTPAYTPHPLPSALQQELQPQIDLLPIKQELRQAARALMDRGLMYAANWAAELVTQIDDTSVSEEHNVNTTSNNINNTQILDKQQQKGRVIRALFTPTSADTPMSTASASAGQTTTAASRTSATVAAATTAVLDDHLLLAKSYFDLRQYHRCAHCLLNCPTPSAPHHLFLRLYALYLAGEKRKEEEAHEHPTHLPTNTAHTTQQQQQQSSQASGSSSAAAAAAATNKYAVMNQEIPGIQQELLDLQTHHLLDAFGYYLLALIQRDLGHTEAARDALLTSLNLFPCNWSAWQLLVTLLPDHATLSALQHRLPVHFMRSFFFIHFFIEIPTHTEHHDMSSLFTLLTDLLHWFPYSTYVQSQLALYHYHLQHFDEAQNVLEAIHEAHPYRIEQQDTYSNILYVKEDAANLSVLAHEWMKKDKYREETMIIIGNYYSLKRQHELAILYFRRAIRLNAHCLSAWTLMGHEYIELRNESAAIEAYRHALDICAHDFRAWYGLGQAYELLQLPSYSLYYFRHACALRPFDSRMWCAMAECYEKVDRIEHAIRCYERAESNEDREGLAVLKLAKLYQKRGEEQQAAKYYRKVIQRADERERGDTPTESTTTPAAVGVAGVGDVTRQEEEGGERESHGLLSNALSSSPEAAEAVQYLAEYYKRHNQLNLADKYAQRWMEQGYQRRQQHNALMTTDAQSLIHSVYRCGSHIGVCCPLCVQWSGCGACQVFVA